MVDQDAQPDVSTSEPQGFQGLAGAVRVLAEAIGDLASAMRETAPLVEFVDCATGDCAEAPNDAAAEGSRLRVDARVLPLVPAQDRREPEPATLCRAGGCGCGNDVAGDTAGGGEGRHARRETPPVPAGSTDPGCEAGGVSPDVADREPTASVR